MRIANIPKFQFMTWGSAAVQEMIWGIMHRRINGENNWQINRWWEWSWAAAALILLHSCANLTLFWNRCFTAKDKHLNWPIMPEHNGVEPFLSPFSPVFHLEELLVQTPPPPPPPHITKRLSGSQLSFCLLVIICVQPWLWPYFLQRCSTWKISSSLQH